VTDTVPRAADTDADPGATPDSITRLVRGRIDEVAAGWIELPVLQGIAAGTLEPAVFRNYLEQDFLYITYYARIYVRLAAASADDDLVERFVSLAHAIFSTELDHHRRAAAPFGCDFESVTPSAELLDYLAFFEEIKDDAAETLVGMTPCIYGYGVALSQLRAASTGEGDYARWLQVYSGVEYEAAMDRHLALLDDLDISPARALELTDRALGLERAFWNQRPGQDTGA
jgi:thiaminase